ncbi:hypothetical protein EDC04DRAFT_2735825 [Pisolithus marmoratus]|nr:hypothetical protein EDC04DRAFT_2735825 [Pisolithus marmoratus]
MFWLWLPSPFLTYSLSSFSLGHHPAMHVSSHCWSALCNSLVLSQADLATNPDAVRLQPVCNTFVAPSLATMRRLQLPKAGTRQSSCCISSLDGMPSNWC